MNPIETYSNNEIYVLKKCFLLQRSKNDLQMTWHLNFLFGQARLLPLIYAKTKRIQRFAKKEKLKLVQETLIWIFDR